MGRSFAAIIPRAVGGLDIRRFFRGNMIESYEALKTSGFGEREQILVAKVAGYGVPASCAFATGDWFQNCPLFTPEERRAHDAVRVLSLKRARGARGNRALEEVEGEAMEEGVRAGNDDGGRSLNSF